MAHTEFYCNPAGSNLNSGSSTATTAAFTSTNGNWSTTTNVFTPISGNPSLTVNVGDFASIYIDGATVAVYIARVTAVSTTTITLSSTAISGTAPITSTTARTCKVGGAWKGPNAAENFPFNFIAKTATNATGNLPRVNLKNGTTYSVTAAITHALADITFQGYTTSVGDGGRANIDGGTTGTSYVLFTAVTNTSVYRDLIFSNNGATGTADGVVSSIAGVYWDRCVFHNFTLNGLNVSANGTNINECEAYSCNTSNTATSGGFKTSANCSFNRCISHDNSGASNNGFVNVGAFVVYQACVADTNGLHGWLTSTTQSHTHLRQCVSYNNGGAGFSTGSGVNVTLLAENNILVSNTTYGIDFSAPSGGRCILRNNAYYNNTTNQTNLSATLAIDDTGAITLTALPWIDAANGDFRLNRALLALGAGRGAFTQTQGSYGNASMLSRPDVGAVQRKESPRKIPTIA